MIVTLILINCAASSAQDSPCSGGKYDLPSRLVGTWKEYTVTEKGEVLAGTLKSGFEVGGCVFSQRFLSADGKLSFLSLGYIDPSTDSWHETFVLSNGRVASYRWRQSGDDIIIDRIGGDPRDMRRLRITNIKRDYYEVVEERSSDEGKTWKQFELTRTRREE
jgi:hypothetical protein